MTIARVEIEQLYYSAIYAVYAYSLADNFEQKNITPSKFL